jgi:Bifunctional DNA primase/polymerase, N-terminal
MTIPSFQPCAQDLGRRGEVRMWTPGARAATLIDVTGEHSSPRPRVPSICTTALAYLAAGRSVVPIAPGCKAPSLVDPRTGRPVLIRWERYQEASATPDEVRRWFSARSPMGLGIVAGSVSGITLADGTRAGLEVLDIDDADVHGRFLEMVAACGLRSLLQRLVCEETPGGGAHYGYACVEWAASTILARRQRGTTADGRGKTSTLIETRGEGSQCVVAPTPEGIHPDHPIRDIAWCGGTGPGCR